MRKVKMHVGISLDGKIAGPQHELDWLPSPDSDDYGLAEFNASCDAVLLGYRTYEVCLALGEWPYPNQKAYVFSRSPHKSVIPKAELITHDPAAFVAALKVQPGQDMNLVGGGQLFRLLHEADLIDEICLGIVPIVLGQGITLFPDLKRRQPYRLQKSRTFSNGLVLLWLERAP